MKHTLLALTLAFGSLFATAQTKVGHINTNELVALMPQTDTVKIQLESIRGQWLAELQSMQSTLQTKYNEYIQLQKTPGILAGRLEIREQELQDIQQKIESTKVLADQDLAQKEQDLFQPIIDMVLAAIEKVAKAKGYDFVLDSSEGYNVLYSNPSNDLMMAVRTELRIPVDAKPAESTPGN